MALSTYRQQTGILGATTNCGACGTPSPYPASTSYSNNLNACASIDLTQDFYFTGNNIAIGVEVYTDPGLSNIFIGNNGYYRIDNSGFTQSAQINSLGEIISLSLCP
tara:strand:+ start:6351 stop:6671 length:321 start_codon:yes stop_codon:yes gene_type:complete